MRLIDANEFRQRFNKVYDDSSEEQKRALLKVLVELEKTEAQNVSPKIWHDTTKELPNRSCMVLGVFSYSVQVVPYSKEHNLFNCYDDEENPQYALHNCSRWAHIEDIGLATSRKFEFAVDPNFMRGVDNNG